MSPFLVTCNQMYFSFSIPPVVVVVARTKKSLKNLFLEKIIIPPRKSIPFNVIKRVQLFFSGIFHFWGGFRAPQNIYPLKKIEIFKGAPWSPPSIKKIFIFNKKGPFLCYKIFPIIFFPNFFTTGCLGGPQKIYIFQLFLRGVKKIGISLKPP